MYRGGTKPVKKWDFNGASLDQGLLFYTYVLNNGTVMLLDSNEGAFYLPGYLKKILPLLDVFRGSNGRSPMQSFAHFTGRNKPWLQDLDHTKDKSLLVWKDLLDDLHLSINSTNFRLLGAKPPLGYFASNK